MERDEPKAGERPRSAETRQWVLCPTCGAHTWRVAHSLLNPKTGKAVRVYKCGCGEYVWDD